MFNKIYYDEVSLRRIDTIIDVEILGDKFKEVFIKIHEDNEFKIGFDYLEYLGKPIVKSNVINFDDIVEYIYYMNVTAYDVIKLFEEYPREALLIADLFETEYIRGLMIMDIELFKPFDLTDVKNISYLFFNCPISDELLNKIIQLDVSKIESFEFTFAKSSIRNISKLCYSWNPSKKASFVGMFRNCPITSYEPLKRWFPWKSLEEIIEIVT